MGNETAGVKFPSLSAQTVVANLGEPRYSRRLGDKLLAAFTHAYATGEQEVATKLRELIEGIEANADFGNRRGEEYRNQIESWMAFVDARDNYKTLAADVGDGADRATAFDRMKDAYRRWSGS